MRQQNGHHPIGTIDRSGGINRKDAENPSILGLLPDSVEGNPHPNDEQPSHVFDQLQPSIFLQESNFSFQIHLFQEVLIASAPILATKNLVRIHASVHGSPRSVMMDLCSSGGPLIDH